MENIWWNQVTNAVRYINDIKQSLLEEDSILITSASAIPWRSYLVGAVEESVKQQNSEKKFEHVEVISEPGPYLLDRFCKEGKRNEYRPLKGYANFFATSDDIVLHDRYVWVKVSSADNLAQWLAIVSDYLKERDIEKNKAVFIIEWTGGDMPATRKGIKEYSFDDYIGEYDLIVFAVLATSSIKEEPFIRTYLAELVANVVGNDIELAAECIVHRKKFLKNPIDFIRTTCENSKRSDDEFFCFSKDEDEVKQLIWKSQIKIVYPYLEEYRSEFVKRYRNEISRQLPIESTNGEKYEDASDVELGTLMYMAGNSDITLDMREYEKLSKYKEARNKLSHLTPLTIEEIRNLLE